MSDLIEEFNNIESEQDRVQREMKEKEYEREKYCVDDGKEEYVWVLQVGNYEDEHIIEICTTEQKANKIASMYNIDYEGIYIVHIRKMRLNVII